MKKFAKLPFEFDKQLLQQDLALINKSDWLEVPTNYANKDAVWGIDLFVIDFDKTMPGEQIFYKQSDVLKRCSYLQKVLQQFSSCKILKARINLLKAKEGIQPHRDGYGYSNGQPRIHIPIKTNPAFSFTVENESMFFPEGECWYVNTRLEHQVKNDGTKDRIHLVIDCEVDDWLESVFVNIGFPSLEEAKKAILY